MNNLDRMMISGLETEIKNIGELKFITIEVAELKRLISIAKKGDKSGKY